MTPNQLASAVLLVFATTALAAVLIFQRGRVRNLVYPLIAMFALVSATAWTDFGQFQRVYVDVRDPAPPGAAVDSARFAPNRPKQLEHRPFHFHDFFHYYLGAKYFPELGYIGLYDCVTLADQEIAAEQQRQPRITGYVRNLEDVLVDKTHEDAVASCRNGFRARFTAERWAAFETDIRELQRLVGDDAWPAVVYDAGFNPPPSWVMLGHPLARLIPLRAGSVPTYLVASTLDLSLLVACFLVFRASFGRLTAAIAVVFFGASLLAHYSWNGGSFLRFTWLTYIVLSLSAMKRERWALAGVLLGAATCDRVFPAAFAACSMVPVGLEALRGDAASRRVLRRFGAAYGATVIALVAASAAVFGPSAWMVFFSRILRHGDVYYVMHVGVKKVLTYRDWVPSKNFGGHDGLARFKDWNLALRATWASMRPLVLPLQALVAVATAAAATRRRPYEAALLGGVVFMFFFNLPANYYWAVLALVPALLFRGAATARSERQRFGDALAFLACATFWMLTLIAPFLSPDMIVYDFYICLALLFFFVIWLAAWLQSSRLRELLEELRGLANLRGEERGDAHGEAQSGS